MTRTLLRRAPANRAIRLRNVTCPYCGTQLNRLNRSAEHVIGRRFVPEGTLTGMWNLIVWACQSCNSAKARLEDDISAITMQPDALGHYPCVDQRLKSESIRKECGSFSRRSKNRVADSAEKLVVVENLAPGVTIDFQLYAPPQIDPDRVFTLASAQGMAFFYWLTFDDTSRRGFWPSGDFMPITFAARGDWGNKLMRGFMEATSEWEPRLIGIGADGFYKIAIRRNPMQDLWSLALEWNMNYRVTAAFGDVACIKEFTDKLPKLECIKLRDDYWGRKEVTLDDKSDAMFLATYQIVKRE